MVCRNSQFISVCGEAVGGWLPLSCVSPPAASLQTFSNQIFSFLSQTVCVGRMSYFLLQKLADLCAAGRLVEEVVVSGCVPEPVPLAYVTTVLPAAGGGGGLPHHPLPQLRTLRSTWQHALQAALHPPAHGLLRLFPPWCNNPGLRRPYLPHQLPLTTHGDVTLSRQHTWTTC